MIFLLLLPGRCKLQDFKVKISIVEPGSFRGAQRMQKSQEQVRGHVPLPRDLQAAVLQPLVLPTYRSFPGTVLGSTKLLP
ncbi:hypothetical protein Y1Q_0022119 [Alligator mississippiensis]|uniref:Uncharacterized protein n=1 Tax=Alligator mississippiensis TaxID=8496 RepID=A0A151MMD4_ALLMI|nr:hypothetical protein Y1Q_0022119 [Alligator mississippiensis]